MINRMIIFFGKKFYPDDEPWDQRRKMESVMGCMTVVLLAVGAMFIYSCFVAHFFMKISVR